MFLELFNFHLLINMYLYIISCVAENVIIYVSTVLWIFSTHAEFAFSPLMAILTAVNVS